MYVYMCVYIYTTTATLVSIGAEEVAERTEARRMHRLISVSF